MTRPQAGRTSENEIAIAALRVAQGLPNGEATTSELMRYIPDFVDLTKRDMETSPSRPSERKFHQIVRNLISHREATGNIITDGYAKYTGSGIRLTEVGRAHLKHLGYE